MVHFSQGEVSQATEERSEKQSEKYKEGEVGHQVKPFSAILIQSKSTEDFYQVRMREYIGRNGAKDPET